MAFELLTVLSSSFLSEGSVEIATTEQLLNNGAVSTAHEMVIIYFFTFDEVAVFVVVVAVISINDDDGLVECDVVVVGVNVDSTSVVSGSQENALSESCLVSNTIECGFISCDISAFWVFKEDAHFVVHGAPVVLEFIDIVSIENILTEWMMKEEAILVVSGAPFIVEFGDIVFREIHFTQSVIQEDSIAEGFVTH